MKLSLKFVSVILSLVLFFTLSGCSKTGNVKVDSIKTNTSNEVVHLGKTCVDIGVNKDGYYSLYSDIDIHYYENEISWIYLDNPTLLGYNISSEWKGGIYLMSGKEGKKINKTLEKALKSAEEAGDEKLAQELKKAIEIMDSSGPLKQRST